MKKTWNIVSGKSDRVLNDTPIKGTKQQAEAFMYLNYDVGTSGCSVQEQKTIDLDEIEFDVDLADVVDASWNGEILFTVVNKKGEFILIDQDGFKLEEVSVELLKFFPKFKRLVVCELCEGEGQYMEQGCNYTASMCCGGCEISVPCECESVIFSE